MWRVSGVIFIRRLWLRRRIAILILIERGFGSESDEMRTGRKPAGIIVNLKRMRSSPIDETTPLTADPSRDVGARLQPNPEQQRAPHSTLYLIARLTFGFPLSLPQRLHPLLLHLRHPRHLLPLLHRPYHRHHAPGDIPRRLQLHSCASQDHGCHTAGSKIILMTLCGGVIPGGQCRGDDGGGERCLIWWRRK